MALDWPNGGEVLTAGETVSIQWHEVVPHSLQNWDLSYSTTGSDGPWLDIVIDLPPENTTFEWTVPDAPSEQVRVRVKQDNLSGIDYLGQSASDLTITSAGAVFDNDFESGGTTGWSSTVP